jgi:ornithine carbamoyltransferase
MAATSQKQVLYDSITSVWLAQWFVMENPALRVILVHCLPAKRGRIPRLTQNANLKARVNLHR